MTKDEFWTNEELALGLLDKLRFKLGNLECTIIDINPIIKTITIVYFSLYLKDYEECCIIEQSLYDYEKM